MVFNVTCVMWVTHADIYIIVQKEINNNPPPLLNTKNMHGTMPQDLLRRFKVLKKCRNKFDRLVYEMLFIRALKPNLNVQSDSIRAKVFL